MALAGNVFLVHAGAQIGPRGTSEIPMTARLPVKLRKTPGGFVVECGDPQARLYIYTESERISRRHLDPTAAEAFAKDVARALRQAWIVQGKHG